MSWVDVTDLLSGARFYGFSAMTLSDSFMTQM